MRHGVRTMKTNIEIADSLDEYLLHWTKCIADVHWFDNPSPFDYNREEMAEEIAKEFNQPECIHLVAKSERSNEVLGTLKVKIQANVGTLGRWEPAIPVKHRKSRVGEALIEEAFIILRKNHSSRARCILKFPFNQPVKARWLLSLYQKCGFVKGRPSNILLLADLSKVTIKPSALRDVRIVDGGDFSLEDFADFTLRAYMSMPQDKEVHQGDPYISNRENVLKVLEAIKAGNMGFFPPECCQIAKLKTDIAGFIIGFIRKETKYQPTFGVIGELGVFPEFRRKGIAMFLIANIFACFRKHGCSYSLVGTPKLNRSAIKLYCKIGYAPAFEQIDFEKTLS